MSNQVAPFFASFNTSREIFSPSYCILLDDFPVPTELIPTPIPTPTIELIFPITTTTLTINLNPRVEIRARKIKEQKDFTDSRKDSLILDMIATGAVAGLTATTLIKGKLSKKEPKKSATVWPAAGPVLGAALGIAARLSEDNNVHSLTKAAFCDSATNKAFSAINAFKQWEIKNFAALTPTVLMAGKFSLSGISAMRQSLKNRTTEPMSKWLSNEWKNLPKKDAVVSASLFALSFFTNIAQGYVMPAGFDPSGHVIMKAATTYQMLTAYQYLQNSGYTKLADTAGLLMTVSDGFFMFNTAGCYHRVSETVLAAGIATALKFGTDQIANRFIKD